VRPAGSARPGVRPRAGAPVAAAPLAAAGGPGRAPGTRQPRRAARPGGGGAAPGRAARSARRNPRDRGRPLLSRRPGRLQTRLRGCAAGGGRPPGAEISPRKLAARPP